jgi:hypothetical protein
MPKIDEVERAQPKRTARTLEKKNTDKEAKKAINDNMKGMTNDELHGTLDSEGYTCYQRIAQRKRLHRTDPQAFPCGANFYKDTHIIPCHTIQ